MTVKELKETLIALGVPEGVFKDMKKPQLEELLAEKNDDPSLEADQSILLRITSKRKDGSREYWLEDGTKLPFDQCKDFFPKANSESPAHKAKDYAQLIDGKWYLYFKEELPIQK